LKSEIPLKATAMTFLALAKVGGSAFLAFGLRSFGGSAYDPDLRAGVKSAR
jgi:hypothetical protein